MVLFIFLLCFFTNKKKKKHGVFLYQVYTSIHLSLWVEFFKYLTPIGLRCRFSQGHYNTLIKVIPFYLWAYEFIVLLGCELQSDVPRYRFSVTIPLYLDLSASWSLTRFPIPFEEKHLWLCHDSDTCIFHCSSADIFKMMSVTFPPFSVLHRVQIALGCGKLQTELILVWFQQWLASCYFSIKVGFVEWANKICPLNRVSCWSYAFLQLIQTYHTLSSAFFIIFLPSLSV